MSGEEFFSFDDYKKAISFAKREKYDGIIMFSFED